MFNTDLERVRSAADALVGPTRFDAATWFARLFVMAAGITVLTGLMLYLDTRTTGGEPVWLKPLKFASSFAVLFATLAWIVRKLSRSWRTSWLLLLSAAASTAAFFFELAYISAQAAQQSPSHFYQDTPFHALMYALMGTGATALLLTVVIVAGAAWLDDAPRMQPRMRLGVILGFLLAAGLTFIIGDALVENGGRYVGAPSVDGPRIPFLGWSMEVGDLRAAHFFALHAMQVLPVCGVLVDRCDLPSRVMWIAGLLYAGFAVTVHLKALEGVPLITV